MVAIFSMSEMEAVEPLPNAAMLMGRRVRSARVPVLHDVPAMTKTTIR